MIDWVIDFDVLGNLWYFIFRFIVLLFPKIFVGLVWFYGISTIVGYLMPNPFYTYILNMYDLVWFAFMAYQPLKVI